MPYLNSSGDWHGHHSPGVFRCRPKQGYALEPRSRPRERLGSIGVLANYPGPALTHTVELILSIQSAGRASPFGRPGIPGSTRLERHRLALTQNGTRNLNNADFACTGAVGVFSNYPQTNAVNLCQTCSNAIDWDVRHRFGVVGTNS